MFKIAFSGFDGIGKSQQIQLIRLGTNNITHHLKKLVEYGDGWPALSETESHHWWFDQVNFDTLATIIIDSLNERASRCLADKINILDRGTKMFKAVLAATFVIKGLGNIENAYEYIDNLFSNFLNYSLDEYEFLLIPDTIYQEKIKPLCNIVNNKINEYSPDQIIRYKKYQEYLGYAIDHYYSDIYQEQKITVNNCLIDIQNEIRARINAKYDLNLPILCKGFKKGIALGGLSESGKSSFGDILSKHYGFYRLKLRYFEDILLRSKQTVNESNMGFEFVSFLHCHPHINRASVESIHDPILPAYFKMLFGNRFTLVFLTVPEELRIERTIKTTGRGKEEVLVEIKAKDEIKKSRGACKVEDIADLIFNNTENRLKSATENFAEALGLEPI